MGNARADTFLPPSGPRVDAAPPCQYNSYILKSVAFEWDARKNAANRRKHGIDFVDAVRIFDGPIVEGPDERED